MNEADCDRIELALGYPLPHEYRDFLRRHGAEVRRLKERLPLRAMLWTEADDIIRENLSARTYADAMTIGEDAVPWPEEFMVVGTNGGGDYWFVDRSAAQTEIWFWQHEAQTIEARNDSFEAYFAELRQDARNPALWRRARG